MFKMMDVSRHKSLDVVRGYVRNSELFDHGEGLLRVSVIQTKEVDHGQTHTTHCHRGSDCRRCHTICGGRSARAAHPQGMPDS